MKHALEKVIRKENLTQDEVQLVMQTIMAGQASENDISTFLLALREKGPTIDEITGAARIMRRFVVPITSTHRIVLDTCGTGGDKKHTFNISTVAAFVVASCGVAVAKHGNRSVSSKCGSADLLEKLGVNLQLEPQQVTACLNTVGIAFLFAQRHHPAMKYVAPIRKRLGVETIFNVLGPLSNPAAATHQIMGVYNRDLVEPLARVLANIGVARALVVHGSDGLDEITTTGKTFVAEYTGTEIITYDIEPDDVGFTRAQPEDLLGGDIDANAEICLDILSGAHGPRRDIVVLNAACGLYICGKAASVAQGIVVAQDALDSGRARAKLDELKRFSTMQGV